MAEEGSYNNLIKLCLDKMPNGGFTPQEMRLRINIINKMKDESFELEDAEYVKLNECVKQMTWGMLDEGILEFVEYIESIGE